MDKIIAKIRESRSVVADFKLNRGGVYYEAGFAAGLGLPVFCLCAEGQTDPESQDRVHFDVAHLNILRWDQNNLTRLSERLQDRIMAVIGRGPRT
jgi:nucleoside 2-deoxyribosyltransferase